MSRFRRTRHRLLGVSPFGSMFAACRRTMTPLMPTRPATIAIALLSLSLAACTAATQDLEDASRLDAGGAGDITDGPTFSFDAGYACGAQTCTVGLSYCQTNNPNTLQFPDAGPGRSCLDLDDQCRRTPTCACLGYTTAASEPCRCSDGNGFVEITCDPV
jgi:hypothetical protein